MATQAEIRQRVYNLLHGTFPTERPFVTYATVSFNNSITTITVADGDHWDIGDIIESVDGDGEQMVVTAKAGDVLTVLRGWNGTTPTAVTVSTTSGVLLKNPRFAQKNVDDAITSTLRMLEGWGIHSFANGSITRADPKEFYELSETDIFNLRGILRVFEVDENYEFPRALPFRYQFSLGTDPTEYSAGYGIRILDWGTRNNGEDVFFTYAKLIDDVADLLPRQEELVVVGAAVILMGGTIAPATHDPGARTDRTVAPGQTSRDVRFFQGRFYTEARIEEAQLSVECQRFLQEQPRQARARRWVG